MGVWVRGGGGGGRESQCFFVIVHVEDLYAYPIDSQPCSVHPLACQHRWRHAEEGIRWIRQGRQGMLLMAHIAKERRRCHTKGTRRQHHLSVTPIASAPHRDHLHAVHDGQHAEDADHGGDVDDLVALLVHRVRACLGSLLQLLGDLDGEEDEEEEPEGDVEDGPVGDAAAGAVGEVEGGGEDDAEECEGEETDAKVRRGEAGDFECGPVCGILPLTPEAQNG